MTETALPIPATDVTAGMPRPRPLTRTLRYLLTRVAVVLVTLVLGVYIANIVANLGGYTDNLNRATISEMANAMGEGLTNLSFEERHAIFEQNVHDLEKAFGLDQPFLLRCLKWTSEDLQFKRVSPIIWETLPNTLLLFGVASFLLFFASLSMSLYLARKYGTWLDKLMIALSPISSAPSWVIGILLSIILAWNLRVLPGFGMYDLMPATSQWDRAWMVIRHLILPVASVFLSMFFQVTYAWRTFFLIHSGDDYVEMAQAKGLPPRVLERQYLLRPSLPYIVTSFTLLVLGFWQSVIALEYFFSWPGVGRLYIDSIHYERYYPGVASDLIVIFACLLALSILILDIVYILIDPRVGNEVRQNTASIKLRGSANGEKARPAQVIRLEPPAWRWKSSQEPTALPLQRPATRGLRAAGEWLVPFVRTLWSYPSAVIGLVIILVMTVISLYTFITVPYSKMVSMWRSDIQFENPELAWPVWSNWFRKVKLPQSITISSEKGQAAQVVNAISPDVSETVTTFEFDYPYTVTPQDILFTFHAQFTDQRPMVTMTLLKPNGQKFPLGNFSVPADYKWSFVTNYRAQKTAFLPQKGEDVMQTAFTDATGYATIPLTGRYILEVKSYTFSKGDHLDLTLQVLGKVFGLAGTDNQRRDLATALLWGTPIALAMGILGAVCTSLLSMMIAAVGAWFGGWVDGIIQGITEINMILPILPIGVMVYFLYSKRIWVIVGVIVLLSVFGSPLKNYRAAFLHIKNASHIEAARAYGAGDRRIIFRYLVPSILPVLIPQLVILVPGFVFLEATLSILGIGESLIPTWGGLTFRALANGAMRGAYYWIAEPVVLLMVTGVAFAMVGFALDRIFNPRLRDL